MKFISITKGLSGILLASVLVACGGGGGDSAPSAPPVATVPPVVAPPVVAPPVVAPPVATPDKGQPNLAYPIPSALWSAPAGATPATGNYIYLESGSGDYIGLGRSYLYTQANSLFVPKGSTLGIDITLQADEDWRANFLLPGAAGKLQAGYFKDLVRSAWELPAEGGISWSGEGRGCGAPKGWVAIDNIVQSNGVITALDLRFEQVCDNSPAPLRGQIHWTRANAEQGAAPGPAAIPAGLWQVTPPAAAAAGNYLYLEGGYGNYISNGQSHLYTAADTTFKVTTAGNRATVGITGDEGWTGDFQGMQSLDRLTVGYYANLQRYPFHNPVLGGLSWSGEGRGCNTLQGWFIVDKVSYSGASITELDLRFEQFCDGNNVPLRGQLHWNAGNIASAPGPQAVPAGLWTPGPSFRAPASNYVYTVSEQGDYVGGGLTELLTPATTAFSVETNLTAAFRITAGGSSGEFFGMNSLSQLQPGFYGSLQRYPFHNPNRGGMDWNSPGRGCNRLDGWFVVDRVSYALGQLTAIDLRFEQRCQGASAAMHGVIHWEK